MNIINFHDLNGSLYGKMNIPGPSKFRTLRPNFGQDGLRTVRDEDRVRSEITQLPMTV